MRAVRTKAEQRREALVGVVATMLDRGEPTRFAYEGATIAGLRAGWCLSLWPWRDADATAREVVNEALRRLGVSRPTWEQGQPESIEPVGQPRSVCIHCGSPLPDDMPIKGHHRKYCSRVCKQNHLAEKSRKDGRRHTAAEREAAAAAIKAARLARPCAECGKPIMNTARRAKFCSQACANTNIGRRVRGIPKPRS